MLIDKRYFTGDIYIPNLTSSGTGASDFVSKSNELVLNKLIVKHEKLFMEKVLGKEMTTLFLCELEKTPVEEKWSTLKCRLVDQENLVSPLANYVYYWYTRDRFTETTGTGEVITRTSNAVITSPADKMARAWNEMVDQVKELVFWFYAKKAIYPEVVPNFYADIFYPINTFNL